jgi:hypothetical protein|tara:strand:+ start:100 stop:390 length:291 start_codon:yes stop_codon:yes gene_type:complete
MSSKIPKIEIGDLVKVKEKFVYPNQDILLLPYNKDSIGLVLKIESGGYLYDSDIDISSAFGHYVTVKWGGVDSTICSDDEYVHLEDELEIISKAKD